MKPSRLFIIAVSLCCQLKTPFNDDAASNLITQNFVFTICGVHSLMGQMEYLNSPNFWSSLEEHEQGRFLKAFQLLDSRKGRSVYFSLTSGDQKDHDHSKDIRYLIISYLLKRMGKIALQMDAIQVCFPDVEKYDLLGYYRYSLKISTRFWFLFRNYSYSWNQHASLSVTNDLLNVYADENCIQLFWKNFITNQSGWLPALCIWNPSTPI